MRRSTCAWLAFTSLLLQCYFLFMLQRQSLYVRQLHEAEDIIVPVANPQVTNKEHPNKVTYDVTLQLSTLVPEKNCTIPDSWLYPLCAYKVEWLTNLWNTNKECYVDRHGMDPNDVCSVLVFLSEVEAWCPIMPWRRHLYPHPSSGKRKDQQQVKIRTELDELFQEKMSDSKYQWMRDRITRLWPDWRLAAKALEVENPTFRNRQHKNIFLFMGSYSVRDDWLANAYKGVPLGEMVQWSDLIASLYALGHNITISAEQPSMKKILNATADKGCGRRLRKKEFDLIFTDYVGSWLIRTNLGPTSSHYRCRLRILDSFGTDPEFNYAEYKEGASLKTGWGKSDVHVRQMMTMFPHSPDNLFLGFVVDKATNMETNPIPDQDTNSNKPIGLLYAKDAVYLQGRRQYLDILNKYLEIHATIANEKNISKDAIKKYVPDYIINHGIMKGADLKKLLRRSQVFIGLAFPYEGPGPLEAIAQGCVFINPKLNPPLNRENSGFFGGKPTFRALTSQHPYMEKFVGKPHVYSIDINDLSLVESTIKEIVSKKVVKRQSVSTTTVLFKNYTNPDDHTRQTTDTPGFKPCTVIYIPVINLQVSPFLPYEWSTKGMLERVNMFVEKLNFCEEDEQWPPLKEMHLVLGSKGNSCKDACGQNGFLCEPSFFNRINSVKEFEKIGISCTRHAREETLVEPSYNPADQSCTTQAMSLLFSCVARNSARMRLCPCRDYQPQQVAFCRNCR